MVSPPAGRARLSKSRKAEHRTVSRLTAVRCRSLREDDLSAHACLLRQMNKTQVIQMAFGYLNGLSPYFFDRGLTIASDVAPAVLTREALQQIRDAAQT